jgi:RNA polymerase sigma-70 factor (ECF subfamily)
MAVRAQHLDAEQLRDLYPDVVRVASRIVGNDAAEDVAQETFLRLLAVAQPRRPRAWLARVARNLAIDEVRRRKRSAPVETPPEKDVEDPDVAELLSVRRAMQDLPERYRLVLWLKHVEGRTAAEIAQITGVTQSSVEMSLFRARRSLAESYTKRAGFLSPVLAALIAVRRWFAHGATAGKVSIALAAAVGVAASVGLPVVRSSGNAGASNTHAVAAPHSMSASIAEPASMLPAPPPVIAHAPVAVASSAAALPLDQVIAQARAIVVGVVQGVAWDNAHTQIWLHTQDVWYGPGQSDQDIRFALDGHPWVGPGTRLVAFLAKTNTALGVRRDGSLFDMTGRALRLTLTQLEARVHADHNGPKRGDEARPSGRDEEAQHQHSLADWLATLLAQR